MRVLFAGTPEAAVPSLRALLESEHEVVGVLTRPDSRSGRGRRLFPSPARVVAEEAGVPVLTPRGLRDPEVARGRWPSWPLRPAPVVAYGALVPPSLLDLPRHGWVNLHFSLLPAWRGAAPVQHAIMAGDTMTGATTFLLEEGLDTGPVLGTLTEPIRATDTAGHLLDRLAVAGAGLLVATLDALAAGDLQPQPQPGDGVSLAPKLSVEDARIRWERPAYAVDRQIRGCTPAPGAWTTFRGAAAQGAAGAAGGRAPRVGPAARRWGAGQPPGGAGGHWQRRGQARPGPAARQGRHAGRRLGPWCPPRGRRGARG